MEQLTAVGDLYRDDVVVDEFDTESCNIPDEPSLFVAGELRVDAGEWTVVGTDGTPLLLSDSGADASDGGRDGPA